MFIMRNKMNEWMNEWANEWEWGHIINPFDCKIFIIISNGKLPVQIDRKAEHLHSAFKKLRHGSHRLTCKEHHACLSVYTMALWLLYSSYDNFFRWRGLCQQMLPRHWCKPLYPVDWIIARHCCMACLKGWCVVYNRSRTPPRDL